MNHTTQLHLFCHIGRYFGPDEDPSLSMGSKTVWAHIYRMAKKTGSCSPSLEWFARRLGRSIRQIARYIDELVAVGWLEVRRRRRASSRYLPSDPRNAWPVGDGNASDVEPCSAISVPDERQLSLLGSLDSNTPKFDANVEQRLIEATAETKFRGFLLQRSWADRNPDAPVLSRSDTVEHLKIWAGGLGDFRDLADIEDGSGMSPEDFATTLQQVGERLSATQAKKPVPDKALSEIAEGLTFIDTLGWISKPLKSDRILAHIEKRIEFHGISSAAAFESIKNAFQRAYKRDHLRPRSWGWFLGVIDQSVS